MTLACGHQPPARAAAEIPAVAASISPVADLLARIGGDDFQVTSLFGPGVHPRQSQAKKTALPDVAALYVRVGGTFEGRSDSSVMTKAGRVLNLSAGLELIGEAVEERVERKILAAALGADAPETRGGNPWFWLDPLMAAAAADLMAAALVELRPEAADRIAQRTEAIRVELTQLDREIAALLAGAAGKPFPVFTTSWSYFARRYGLDEVHLAAVVPGGGPGRHSLKGAAERLRGTGAGRAFTDLTFPLSPAAAVCSRAGAQLVTLYPLGRVTNDNGSVFSLLREAARAVAGEKP